MVISFIKVIVWDAMVFDFLKKVEASFVYVNHLLVFKQFLFYVN